MPNLKNANFWLRSYKFILLFKSTGYHKNDKTGMLSVQTGQIQCLFKLKNENENFPHQREN